MRNAGLIVTIWALFCCFGALSACSEPYFDTAPPTSADEDVELFESCQADGSQRTCPCDDGSRGTQECSGGSWAECECEDPLGTTCNPGDEPVCLCADGRESVRQCEGGELTACICEATADNCTTCHAYPPADPHPSSTDCSNCHSALNEDDLTFADDTTHMNGSADVNCSACHGMPPAAPHVASTACSSCHGEVVDASGQIINPGLHRDGTVQVVATGGCDTCHGQPPTAPHTTSADCSQCHWNIDADDVTFADPGTHNNGNVELDCLACHADAGTTTPMNHNIDGDAATVSANCQVCHDLSQHQSGNILFNDPDPGDSIDPTVGGAGAADLLCETCHDGGSGTYFGGATPQDMSNLWTAPAAHSTVNCSFCHGYHGGDPDRPLVADAEESGCVNCHPTNVYEMSPGGSNTRHAVVDAEQSAGALECITCHEPHTVANSPWRPITDPDDGSLVAASDVPSGTATGAGSDTNTFCLDCHNGSWTAAINISAELNNSDTVNSSFGEWSGGTWDKNLHRKHVDDKNFACTECHNTHSNTGNSGTENRGRLLYSYIRVNGFPYTGKSSCSILAGFPSGCHH